MRDIVERSAVVFVVVMSDAGLAAVMFMLAGDTEPNDAFAALQRERKTRAISVSIA